MKPHPPSRRSSVPAVINFVHQIRPIDRWFVETVLPNEPAFIARAQRLTKSPEAADDLVQEAYARLLGIDGWHALDNPRAYVFRILRNLAVEQIRRARVVDFQHLSGLETFDIADETPGTFQVVAAKDELASLFRAIDDLPERNRTVIRMRRIEDAPPRKIAQRLGLSLSTVEKRLARGLFLLTRALETGASTAKDSETDTSHKNVASRDDEDGGGGRAVRPKGMCFDDR